MRHPWSAGGPTGEQFRINRRSQQAIGLELWWAALISRGTTQLRELCRGSAPLDLQGGAAYILNGERGWVLDLDGTDDYATLSAVPVRFTDTLTITFRVNFDVLDASGYYCLLSYGGYVSGGFMVNRLDNPSYGSKVAFAWGGTDFYVGEPVTATGEWIFMAITVKAGVPQNHFVGRNSTGITKTAFTRSVGSGTFSATSPQTMTIGRREDAAIQYVNGKFSDVRLYGAELSDATLYQIWSPPTNWDLYQLIRSAGKGITSVSGQVLSAAAAVATWAGRAATAVPGVATIAASAAAATWAGRGVVVVTTLYLSVTAAVATWVGQAASRSAVVSLGTAAASAAWSGRSAAVSAAKSIAATVAAATWAGAVSVVAAAVSVVAGAAAATWIGQAAVLVGDGVAALASGGGWIAAIIRRRR